jgi:hypothetical protein
MLASDWIKFLDRELFTHGLFVLGGRVEVTGAGGGFELDFFTHDSCLPELDNATCAKVGEYDINAVLVDQADASGGKAEADEAVFAFDPEAAALQIRQKAALGVVVGVRNIVSHHRLLAGDDTDA